MEPWAGLGIVVTPASLIDHHASGYAYDTESICQPKLKFRDDVKVFGDHGGLKQIIDSNITLKLADDRQTLKVVDDGPTLKLLDDGGGTLKIFDDGGGTLKAIDDVKIAALDIGFPAKAALDTILPGTFEGLPPVEGGEPGQGVAPFVLATPHHTMAWATTFPGALEQAIAQLDLQVASFEGVVAELERRQGRGDSAEAETAQLEMHRRELAGIREERETLLRHLRK